MRGIAVLTGVDAPALAADPGRVAAIRPRRCAVGAVLAQRRARTAHFSRVGLWLGCGCGDRGAGELCWV